MGPDIRRKNGFGYLMIPRATLPPVVPVDALHDAARAPTP